MPTAPDMHLWPGPERRQALLDFWTVYDRHYDEISAEMMPWVDAHPLFGPMVAAMPPERMNQQRTESRDRMQAAVHGDWGPYEENLRMQGVTYARMGMAFRDWYDVIRLFERFLVPRLVTEYLAAPDRLSATIIAMQGFLDSAMSTLAESYLDAKENALRESERRLAITLESIGDAVIATDTRGVVTLVNPVATQLTGWSQSEALGRPLREVFNIRNELTGAVAEAPVERVLREGHVVGLANHTELIARDGSVCPIADSAAPIRGNDGEIAGVVMVFRDQREERRTEEMRIHGIRLEEQNLRVQEASRLKSAFLANMSHELRTPLNAILGFSQLIQDEEAGPVTSQQSIFLGHILASGRHLLKLINDVLDLSKVESGKMEFFPEPIDLVQLMKEVEGTFGPACQKRGIVISVDIAQDVTRIVADPARLRQVLDNYVSNAVKFTPDGGRIDIVARGEASSHVRIEVADSGIGIAAEDIPRLFTEFQQLDPGMAKQHQGTGLGLALTRRLVEAQHGRVGVRSVVGEGSVFFAVLPSGIAERGGVRPDGRRPILVIDDDEGSLALMTSVLEQLGHPVVCARDAESGLALAEDVHPLAVVLDLILPRLDGFAFLDRFRAAGHDEPLVVWTMKDLSSEERRRLRSSVQAILQKGETGGAPLLETLRTILPPLLTGARDVW